ncbi:hypothetical protein GUJ93_ZPchr0006g43448 [Zizania palustris]|uniref:Uncharacterized protein n=1 Tax=Zizania palustris TaxID=103762 RepID=A0A8J5VW52_ZIZPA|nr:hypothetical protein GUJ93_ZPchr0006g43448 [Zizania palustris]
MTDMSQGRVSTRLQGRRSPASAWAGGPPYEAERRGGARRLEPSATRGRRTAGPAADRRNRRDRGVVVSQKEAVAAGRLAYLASHALAARAPAIGSMVRIAGEKKKCSRRRSPSPRRSDGW